MEKLVFDCEKDLNDYKVVSDILNSSVYSLKDYLKMDGIRKTQFDMEATALMRNGISTIGQLAQLKSESDNEKECYSTYIPKGKDKGIIKFCFDCFSKNSKLLHMGMSDDELSIFKIYSNEDQSNLNLCLRDVFNVIANNPDSELRLISYLNDFVKSESERKK